MTDITIYTTHTCPYCKMEKDYFDEKGVKYKNFFVDHDQKKAREMMEISGQLGVPFTVIKTEDGVEHTVLGFQKDRLNEILNII